MMVKLWSATKVNARETRWSGKLFF